MRIALDHGIEGIYGDCGGQCACATCHVYIDPQWLDIVGRPEPSSVEAALLEGAPADVTENSRLACQISLTDELDGLLVQIPEGQ
jgi:2Fe-2S ferredoxin